MNYSRVTICVEGRTGGTRDFGPNPADEYTVIVMPAKATWEKNIPNNKKKFGPTTTCKNRKGIIKSS